MSKRMGETTWDRVCGLHDLWASMACAWKIVVAGRNLQSRECSSLLPGTGYLTEGEEECVHGEIWLLVPLAGRSSCWAFFFFCRAPNEWSMSTGR